MENYTIFFSGYFRVLFKGKNIFADQSKAEIRNRLSWPLQLMRGLRSAHVLKK
jgi:hypothetical protein